MVSEQIGYLVAEALSISGPPRRLPKQTPELGKLHLGQSPASQCLRAETETELAA